MLFCSCPVESDEDAARKRVRTGPHRFADLVAQQVEEALEAERSRFLRRFF